MIRRASIQDVDALIRLELRHGRDELGESDSHGHHQALEAHLFDRKAFTALIQSELLLVAQVEQQLVGYAVVASAAFFGSEPFYRRFFTRAKAACLEQGLGNQRLGCYGPVWVAPAFRGKGIFTPLTQALFAESRSQFDTLATFIAEDNQHSLNVHVKSAAMDVVDFFEDEGRGFYLLLKTP